MNTASSSSNVFVREIRAGFLSPIDSLKFLSRHKFLLVSGMAPHICGLGVYLWLIQRYGLDALHARLDEFLHFFASGFGRTMFDLGVYIFALILYSIIGLPLVSTLASPIYDVIAEKTYEDASGRTMPKLGLADFVRSFLSECSKFVFIVSCFIVFFAVPPLAPLGFIFSLWFFGWDHFDRTLSLMGLPLSRRLLFGGKHALACFSLGLWSYIPFAGTILTFAMASAGAVAVARLQSPREIASLDQERRGRVSTSGSH